MDLLLLVKDLLQNKELIRMFLFNFVFLVIIFRDPITIIKVLRKIITIYIILGLLFKY